MHANEFAAVLLWVLLPPLLIGMLALAWLTARRRPRGWRLATSALVLPVLSVFLAFLLVAFGPNWLGRYGGVKDLHILGAHITWAPFAFVAVALAFPGAAWWSTRGGRNEP